MAPAEHRQTHGNKQRGTGVMHRLAVSWIVCTALVATPALAQVYKWVDESGMVNYGDKPPPRSQGAHPLSEGSGSVSVVPGIPKEELDRLRKRDEQQSLQRLEREVDELRARAFSRANAVPETVYTEVYVPTYGYQRPWRRFPGVGHPGPRPEHPIIKPRPPTRPRHGPWQRP
jgi:Domain of unknown function (DUF4124)